MGTITTTPVTIMITRTDQFQVGQFDWRSPALACAHASSPCCLVLPPSALGRRVLDRCAHRRQRVGQDRGRRSAEDVVAAGYRIAAHVRRVEGRLLAAAATPAISCSSRPRPAACKRPRYATRSRTTSCPRCARSRTSRRSSRRTTRAGRASSPKTARSATPRSSSTCRPTTFPSPSPHICAAMVKAANTHDLQVELGGSMFTDQTQPSSEAIGILAAVFILLDRVRFRPRHGPADHDRALRHRHRARVRHDLGQLAQTFRRSRPRSPR